MDGTELAAKYSFITNKLEYCGPHDSYKKFLDFLKTRDEKLKAEIKEELKRFEGLFSYLDHIAKKTGKDMLDHDVVEAYWLGNDLLEKFDHNDLKEIIMSLTKRGLPKSYAEKLTKGIPKGMVPHHSFNVIYVGVGKVTGSVKFNLENINNCLIRPAEVVKKTKDVVMVKEQPYVYEGKKLIPGSFRQRALEYEPKFIYNLNSGDFVSIHWNFIVDKLSTEQKNNLNRYNRINIDALNNSF